MVKDSEGRIRLLVDKSPPMMREVEAVDTEYAEQDMRRVESYFLDLLEGDYFFPSTTKQEIEALQNSVCNLGIIQSGYRWDIYTRRISNDERTSRLIGG